MAVPTRGRWPREMEAFVEPVGAGSIVVNGSLPAARFRLFGGLARHVDFAAADFLLPVPRLLLRMPSGNPGGRLRKDDMVVRPVADGRNVWAGELRGADENEDGGDEHGRSEEKSETARRRAKAVHVESLLVTQQLRAPPERSGSALTLSARIRDCDSE